MRKIKSVYSGGLLVSQFGRETDLIETTDSYVKAIHIDTSLFKTITARFTNFDAANIISYKILGYVDGLGPDYDTIFEGELAANSIENIINAESYLQYSKIEIYVKSKSAGNAASYNWQYFATIY